MRGPNGNYIITNVYFGNHLKAAIFEDDDGDRQTFGNNPANTVERRCIWNIQEGPTGRYHIENKEYGGKLMLNNDEDDDGDRCLYSSDRYCGDRFDWEIGPVSGQHSVFTFRNPFSDNYLKVSWNEDEDADRTVHGNNSDKGVEDSCTERFWWRLEEEEDVVVCPPLEEEEEEDVVVCPPLEEEEEEEEHRNVIVCPPLHEMRGPHGNYIITNVYFGNHLKAAAYEDDDGDRQIFGNNPANTVERRCIWNIQERPTGRCHVKNKEYGGMLMLSNAEDDDGDRCLFSSDRHCGNRFDWEIRPVSGQHSVFTFRNPNSNNYLKMSWNEDEDADRTVHGNNSYKAVEASCTERFWWRLEEEGREDVVVCPPLQEQPTMPHHHGHHGHHGHHDHHHGHFGHHGNGIIGDIIEDALRPHHGHHGFPHHQPTITIVPGYPVAPSYPVGSALPPQAAGPGGYPPAPGPGGYPPAPGPGGYPPAQGGYPPAPRPGAYPPGPGAYPPAPGFGGYPPAPGYGAYAPAPGYATGYASGYGAQPNPSAGSVQTAPPPYNPGM